MVVLATCAATASIECGGASSPATGPAPVPTVAPTPTPVPRPLSVLPPCRLPVSAPASLDCVKPASKLAAVVNAAIDRAMAERPELFDFTDVNGGPKVLNPESYMTAVAAAIGEGGACARIEPEGEIAVKSDNGASEQWIIVSRMGWAVATDHWVQRKYVGTCYPATF